MLSQDDDLSLEMAYTIMVPFKSLMPTSQSWIDFAISLEKDNMHNIFIDVALQFAYEMEQESNPS